MRAWTPARLRARADRLDREAAAVEASGWGTGTCERARADRLRVEADLLEAGAGA